MRSALVYSDHYLKYHFGPAHPFQPERERRTVEKLRELGVIGEYARLVEPEPAREEDLLMVHSGEYVEFVRRMCERGRGYLDYGDTPATSELYEGALWVVGGSLKGAELVRSGEVEHAFNPGGGLHHAGRDHAAGFCVFNDVVLAVRYLQRKGLKKIAVVDTDGHHGDGTQDLLYREPILKISFHREGIYPGTGYPWEVGEGEGKGYSVNVPLPGGTSDDAYLHAFRELVPPLLRAYRPEVLIHQFGVDGHFRDPLVGLGLTTHGYLELSRIMHELAHELCGGRYLVLGGGGYSPSDVCRCWTVMFSSLSGFPLEKLQGLMDERRTSPPEIWREVREVVAEVKRNVFPLHGLEVRE